MQYKKCLYCLEGNASGPNGTQLKDRGQIQRVIVLVIDAENGLQCDLDGSVISTLRSPHQKFCVKHRYITLPFNSTYFLHIWSSIPSVYMYSVYCLLIVHLIWCCSINDQGASNHHFGLHSVLERHSTILTLPPFTSDEICKVCS